MYFTNTALLKTQWTYRTHKLSIAAKPYYWNKTWLALIAAIALFLQLIMAVTSQWARWRLKSPTSRSFAQPFVQAQIKGNSKAPDHWPFWGEFTSGGYPSQGAVTQTFFHLMIWWRHHVCICLCLSRYSFRSTVYAINDTYGFFVSR